MNKAFTPNFSLRLLPALCALLLLGLVTPSYADDLLSGVVCGKDLSGDGIFDDDGEIIACENGVCPHDAVECVATYSDPSCPDGYNYAPLRKRCERGPVCSSGTYNPDTNKCESVAPLSISGGITTYYNSNSGGSTQFSISGSANKLLGELTSVWCDQETWNCSSSTSSTGSITFSGGSSQTDPTCPSGGFLDTTVDVCWLSPICLSGVYDPEMNACYEGDTTCPLGNYTCADIDGSGVNRCSDLSCVDLGDPSNLEDEPTDMTSYQDDGVVDPATGQCSGAFKIFNGRPGECLRPGLKTLFFDCCDADLGSFLFIKEYCPEDNATTVQAVAAKTTHYIGDYCKKKIKFIGCIQKAAMYCLFNSKLARIIHEQGRPQLQKFGSGGGWGVPEGPNCEGFTPEEFQMLDFSKIDLSEFIGDITTRALDQVQQGVQDAVTNFQQNIQ